MPASERLRALVDVGLASRKADLRYEARRILLEKWNEKPPKVVPGAPEPLSVPTFEPTETGFSVQFDNDAAWSKARTRFEKLVAKHPAFAIEEADGSSSASRQRQLVPQRSSRTYGLRRRSARSWGTMGLDRL